MFKYGLGILGALWAVVMTALIVVTLNLGIVSAFVVGVVLGVTLTQLGSYTGGYIDSLR